MSNFKTVSNNKPEDGNKEYLNAIIAMSELRTTSDKKYSELMMSEIKGVIAKSDDISSLVTIRDLVNLKLTTNEADQMDKTNKNIQKDNDSTSRESKDSNVSQNIADESVNSIIINSHQKNYIKKDPNLAKKNSWQDRLKQKYKSTIESFIESSNLSDVLPVEVSDFRRLDFGEYHGSVHSTNKASYRWDENPKNAMVYFFNWIFKKENIKIYFNVPKISEDSMEVKVDISKNYISRPNNHVQQSKEPVGLVEVESDNGSFVSSGSYADKVSGGNNNVHIKGLVESI